MENSSPLTERAAASYFQTAECSIGELTSVSVVSESFANYVYMIVTTEGTYYLKFRPSYFKSRPEISKSQKGIEYELIAIKALSGILGTQVVPTVLFYDPANFIFITSALFGGEGFTYSELLRQGIPFTGIQTLAQKIAQLHSATFGQPLEIRESEVSAKYYQEQYKWLVRNVPYSSKNSKLAADKVLSDLETREKATIFGDLSPKNIIIAQQNAGFCDLETVASGDPEFDIGYLIGHILLHHTKNDSLHEGVHTANLIVDAYLTSITNQRFNPSIEAIMTFAGTSMLYRTFAGLMPEASQNNNDLNDRIEEFANDLIINKLLRTI